MDVLGVEYTLFENGMIGTTIGSGEKGAPAFPLAIFTWTAGNGNEYVRLVVTPYLEQPERGYSSELSDTVLMINNEVPVLKFMFDDMGDLALAMDLKVEGFNEQIFRQSLDLIGAYADYYLQQLSILQE
jgi:hypothetical protein